MNELTKEQELELDKKLHKLKLYLLKNNKIKTWISRVGNSIILDHQIREE